MSIVTIFPAERKGKWEKLCRIVGAPDTGASRPRTPGYFFRVEKVAKKTLKKLRFLRIFLNDGGF